MITCPHCNDEHIVRHSVYRQYKSASDIGIRYRCRNCGKTHMRRVREIDDHKFTNANRTIKHGPDGGRPTRIDWRHA